MIFGIVVLPFIKGKGDSWTDLVKTSNRTLWMLRFACGAIGAIASIITFTKLPMAEAFCTSRLAGDHGNVYGTLPRDFDLGPLIERAMPVERS